MKIAFAILCLLTLGSAVAAIRLRNLIHSVLCLAVTFAGLGGFYLLLNAEFIAFAQILVYVGAVTILVVFAVLLTKGTSLTVGESVFSSSWFKGLGVVALVAGSLVVSIMTTPSIRKPLTENPRLEVKTIGKQMMTTHVITLEVMGLILTAALLGAVVIAMNERKGHANDAKPERKAGLNHL